MRKLLGLVSVLVLGWAMVVTAPTPSTVPVEETTVAAHRGSGRLKNLFHKATHPFKTVRGLRGGC